MKLFTWRTAAWAATAATVPVLVACSNGDDDAPGTPDAIPLSVSSVSSPENLSSGNDSLLRLQAGTGFLVPDVVVTLNGTDVTSKFERAADRLTSLGLVTGLVPGANTVVVKEAAATGRTLATLTVTAHPLQGPVLYVPQESPLRCSTHLFSIYPGGPRLSEAAITDPNCVVATRVDWVYHDKTRAGTAVWQKYDAAAPPATVEKTTLADGRQVPYIVRLETGVINRGIYQIAVVADPAADAAPTAMKPPSLWNSKLVYPFGQSCGGGWYVQGTLMGPDGVAVGGDFERAAVVGHADQGAAGLAQRHERVACTDDADLRRSAHDGGEFGLVARAGDVLGRRDDAARPVAPLGHHTRGRRAAHGSSFSSWPASRNSVASSP